MEMSRGQKVFQRTILEWYAKNGRHDLPWRQTANPYRILVSEVMLQQTQVDRVIGYYVAFLKKFPTAQRLAGASPVDVLRVWKGLGYNRRALNLQRAAQMIVRDYRGRFPRAVAEIEKLPGVGHYTARAVSVFAFNNPEVLIETNIRRVFIHFFCRFQRRHALVATAIRSNAPRAYHHSIGISDKELLPIIERTLYTTNPRLWYSALMDYGALALSDVENPNRRSRHYTKQSRFEGSRRYARAKILDFLLKNKKASIPTLQNDFLTDPHLEQYSERDILTHLLKTLQKEGFIESKKSTWSLVAKA